LASAHRSLLAGRVDDALLSAEAARDVGLTVSPEGAALAHAAQVASIRLAQGRAADLAPTLAALDRLGQRPAWFAALAGLVAVAEDRRPVAEALPAGPSGPSSVWTTALLGALAVELSDVDAARRLAADLAPHVDAWVVAGPAVASAGPVGLTLARLHRLLDDPAAAAAALDRAVVGPTVWLSHVLLERARLLADRDADAAKREAKAARQAAAERGLAGVVERADEVLTGLEGRSAFGLTRREREIMALAVTGVSAKDIAARLYVGERTVETHLANIYRKVNVRSRVELIARFGPPSAS
jgi:DNA-binding CsgD family transcriptional regulator